jgi:hypothetical protein
MKQDFWLRRFEDIATLSDDDNSFIVPMSNMALQDLKIRQAFATK